MSFKTKRHVRGTASDYMNNNKSISVARVKELIRNGQWQLAKLSASSDQLIVMALIEKAIYS